MHQKKMEILFPLYVSVWHYAAYLIGNNVWLPGKFLSCQPRSSTLLLSWFYNFPAEVRMCPMDFS